MEVGQGIVIPLPGSSRLRAFSCDGSDIGPGQGTVPVPSERPQMLRCTWDCCIGVANAILKSPLELAFSILQGGAHQLPVYTSQHGCCRLSLRCKH